MSALPIGGSTGFDHESTAAIDEAARWLALQPQAPSPVIPALRSRFGLSALEACTAIKEASLMRQGATAERPPILLPPLRHLADIVRDVREGKTRPSIRKREDGGAL